MSIRMAAKLVAVAGAAVAAGASGHQGYPPLPNNPNGTNTSTTLGVPISSNSSSPFETNGMNKSRVCELLRDITKKAKDPSQCIPGYCDPKLDERPCPDASTTSSPFETNGVNEESIACEFLRKIIKKAGKPNQCIPVYCGPKRDERPCLDITSTTSSAQEVSKAGRGAHAVVGAPVVVLAGLGIASN
jgi:hypothetical protein